MNSKGNNKKMSKELKMNFFWTVLSQFPSGQLPPDNCLVEMLAPG